MLEKKLDEKFECFIEELGRTDIYDKTSEETIENYTSKVADKLLMYWKVEGFRAYGDGIIWVTNPDNYKEVVDIYLKDTPFEFLDNFYVFSRTAFGDLYLVGEITGQTFTIEMPYNAIVAIEKKMKTIAKNKDEIIQNYFLVSDKEDYDNEDEEGESLFDQALERFGMLGSDEVYAYKKLLKDGGSPTIDNIVKRNIFEYIKDIRAFGMPSVPFAGIEVDYDSLKVSRA